MKGELNFFDFCACCVQRLGATHHSKKHALCGSNTVSHFIRHKLIGQFELGALFRPRRKSSELQSSISFQKIFGVEIHMFECLRLKISRWKERSDVELNSSDPIFKECRNLNHWNHCSPWSKKAIKDLQNHQGAQIQNCPIFSQILSFRARFAAHERSRRV